MLRNFFILATRNFFKNGAYSLINLFGLSIGMAAFILLSLFVRYESSYDSFHNDSERIYRVEQMVTMVNETESWSQLPASTSIVLEEKYAEVEEAITIREVWGEYLSTSKDKTFFEPDGFYANPDIFELFNYEFIAGNKETALDAPMKIVLTESVAKKLFPDSNPIGQSVLADGKKTYIVSGIIEDIPDNTNTKLTYLIPFSTHKSKNGISFFDSWEIHDTRIFIKLNHDVDVDEFEKKITYLFDDFIKDRNDEVYLKPIRIVHLYKNSADGYWIAVLLYGTLGLFILTLAALNFVNLSTAYSFTRAKEIGIKKVVGSSRLRLIKQFLGESLVMVFISLLVAFTIVEASLPLFNRIVSVPLQFNYLGDLPFTFFILGISLLTGVFSSLYPSLILSSLNPLLTIKNQAFKNVRFKKFSLRKGLVIIQLSISIILVLTTFGVLEQFRYLKNKDLGFNKENLLLCSILETKKVKINEFAVLKDELKNITGVLNVSLSYNSPFSGTWGRTINWEGSQIDEKVNCRFNSASPSFLNTLKIDLVAGRNFNKDISSDSTGCLVNESFVNRIGWSYYEAIGKRIWNKRYTIIGIMRDFHINNPTNKIEPYLLIKHTGYLTGYKTLLIKIAKSLPRESIGSIKTLLEEYFPDNYIEIIDFKESMSKDADSIYLGIVKTFGFFSFISIIIAIIGLFALVSYNSKRKVKEIGIRKALGASSGEIFNKLIKEYLLLIVIANLIAIPIGNIIYSIDPSYYKTSINYYNIAFTSIGSIAITVLTISIQVLKTANANPVDSLRYE